MPLGQYEQMEAQARAIREQQRGKDLECCSCPTCDSQWFEEVTISRYKLDHYVTLGQKVPQRPNQQAFVMLKCVRCGDFLEPRVSIDLRDFAHDGYDFLKDTLEGKGDTRKEPKKEDGKLQSEEL
jgi:hypothetical protein